MTVQLLHSHSSFFISVKTLKNSVMKHIYSRTSALILVVILSSFVLINTSCTPTTAGNTDNTPKVAEANGLPQLLPRQGELSKAEEWQKTQAAVNAVNQKIKENPADYNSYIKLAEIFVNEARV